MSVSLFCLFVFLIFMWYVFFINMTNRLKHQREKKSPVSCFLILFQFFSHSGLQENVNFVYKCIFQFNSRGYATFWISYLYIICDKAEFLRTSSNRIDFNTFSFLCLYMWERSSGWYGCLKILCLKKNCFCPAFQDHKNSISTFLNNLPCNPPSLGYGFLVTTVLRCFNVYNH